MKKILCVWAAFCCLTSCHPASQSKTEQDAVSDNKPDIEQPSVKLDDSLKNDVVDEEIVPDSNHENQEEQLVVDTAKDAPENADNPAENENPEEPHVCEIEAVYAGFISDDLASAKKHAKLKVISKKSESAIDYDEWLTKNKFVKQEIPYSDDNYRYEGSADRAQYDFEYRMLTVTDKNGKQYAFDFTALVSNNKFDSYIRYATVKNNILYVSLAHRGYSESNPNTASIIAVDLKGNVLWRSKTLVSNAENFVIVDDTIICGYGFTDEKDFLYTLDLNTGTVVDSIALKSAPKLIFHRDNKIYLATYNTSYELSIQ